MKTVKIKDLVLSTKFPSASQIVDKLLVGSDNTSKRLRKALLKEDDNIELIYTVSHRPNEERTTYIERRLLQTARHLNKIKEPNE